MDEAFVLLDRDTDCMCSVSYEYFAQEQATLNLDNFESSAQTSVCPFHLKPSAPTKHVANLTVEAMDGSPEKKHHRRQGRQCVPALHN
jgi:hypothetical protein